MILTLIFIILIAVLIAVFIGKNLSYVTPIWFFKSFGETNVAVIVFIAFAAGIVFALLCLLIGKVIKPSKTETETSSKNENLKTNEKTSDSVAKEEKKKSFFKKSAKKSEDKESKDIKEESTEKPSVIEMADNSLKNE